LSEKGLEHWLFSSKILFQLGLLHYYDQKWDAMVEVLVEGKNLNQNFAPLLNLLAYYYATKGKNLKEAENLMLKVLQQETNPHFLDTQALVLYKQKKYDDAHKLLATVIKQIPQDSTVLYHLAKTMKKKGMDQEAMNTIQQAVTYCSIIDDKDKYQKCLQSWLNKN
jgi:predicted Zn-dependent protease